MSAWLLWLAKHGHGPWGRYVELLPRAEEMTCLMNFTEEVKRGRGVETELELHNLA